jgi:hypothetical protein
MSNTYGITAEQDASEIYELQARLKQDNKPNMKNVRTTKAQAMADEYTRTKKPTEESIQTSVFKLKRFQNVEARTNTYKRGARSPPPALNRQQQFE